MKRCFFLILICVVASINLAAYDQASVERMLRTRRCPGCDLYRATLYRTDLTGVDLRGATLAYADLRQATLYKADLTGADLRGTIFDGAVWVDGTICQPRSVGTCKRQQD